MKKLRYLISLKIKTKTLTILSDLKFLKYFERLEVWLTNDNCAGLFVHGIIS
jgi:hypothetical protein